MSYSNYDSTIQADLKVELQGWPLGIKFATPSAIGSTSDLKILCDALKTGECAWVAMSRSDQAELVEQLKVRSPKKKRATRSDKGKKWGPRIGKWGRDKKNSTQSVGEDNEDNKNDQHPRKVPCKHENLSKKVPPGVCSCSIISSDGEE